MNILNRSEDDECILSSTHDIDEQREDVLAVGRDVPGMISYGLRFGEKAPMGEKFCPLQAFARFPYQHIISRHQEIVIHLLSNPHSALISRAGIETLLRKWKAVRARVGLVSNARAA